GGGTQGSCLPTYLAWVSFSLGDMSPGGYSTSPTEQNQHNSGLVCCHHDLRPVPNLTVEIVLLVVSWLSGAQEIKLLPRRKSIQPKRQILCSSSAQRPNWPEILGHKVSSIYRVTIGVACQCTHPTTGPF
ncbi:hypothetical protein CH063_00419, partial [Colletotrichum higginsianum]